MRTLVVSDLHIAAASGRDLLRRPELRARLLTSVAGADEVVLLGDVLELREASRADAIDAAAPLFEGLAEALSGGRVVLVPGNHDHRLAAPLLRAHRGRLGLAHEVAVAPSDPLGPLAARMGATELVLAYPGLRLRPNVYATHGHYMDYHATVPTFECVAIALSRKVASEPRDERWTPSHYEAALAPVYGAIEHALQTVGPAREGVGADVSIRVWERLSDGDGTSVIAQLLAGVVFPGAVAAVNRAGLGPFKPDVSGNELRRAGLRAMRAALVRLGVETGHVVFGHTHRAGPLGDDDSDGFEDPGGPRLVNAGCWIYQPALLTPTPGASPYWPGAVVELNGDAPPTVRRLLDDVPHEEMRPAVSRAR